MIQRNGKIALVLGLEELILLKCPYYTKQSTELMQSLSKYPRTRINHPKTYTEQQ